MEVNIAGKGLILNVVMMFLLAGAASSINGSEQGFLNSVETQEVFSAPSYVESSNGLPTEGQWPFSTCVGDINNDGYMDIIRLRGHDDFNEEDQGFQIWLGDGNGVWTKTDIPNGHFGYGGTAIGDFNNDGYLDAAYGVHHNRTHPLIGAWSGDGGTSFSEHSNGLATDGETWAMAPIDFGDFNNDGYMDIGVGSMGGGNGIRVYRNINGGETWVSDSNGLPHNDCYPNVGNWLIWDDINRDGYLDIVVATQITATNENHVIWLGDGNGNWEADDYGLPFEYLWGSYGLDVGDINNDGWHDIAFIKHYEEGSDDWYVPVVYVFDGNTFTDASSGLPNPSNSPEIDFGPLALGDLNNDGYLDLVALEETGSYTNYFTAVHAWLGDGEGHWQEIQEIATGIPGSPESVTLADIDHNNRLDIIVTSDRDDYQPGGIRVYKEQTPRSRLDVTVRKPLGGEVFRAGGVRKIKWTSEIPYGTAKVSIQYSTSGKNGPWHNIVSGLTDSNYYQWTVPNVVTSNGYIKITLHKGSTTVSATNPRPFMIVNANGDFPPFADFTYYIENKTVYFNASTSYDLDGTIVSYEWDFGDGATGNGVLVNHTYGDYGVYDVWLTVRDNDGLTGVAFDTITLPDSNPPEINGFIINPIHQVAGGHVNISAQVNDDTQVADVHLRIVYPDDSLKDFSIKENKTNDVYYCNKTYAQVGKYKCSVWAIDVFGNTAATEYKYFTIGNVLVANAGGSYTVKTNEELQFHGSATGGYPPYTYHWDFGDGTTSDEQNPVHVYGNTGNYTAVLTVMDSKGNTANDTAKVTVLESNPPVVRIIKPESAVYINNKRLIPFPIPFIVGGVDVNVSVFDNQSGVDRVEFYVDNMLKANLTTAPYMWRWDERAFFMHNIRVTAYDTVGNKGSDEINVWRFF